MPVTRRGTLKDGTGDRDELESMIAIRAFLEIAHQGASNLGRIQPGMNPC